MNLDGVDNLKLKTTLEIVRDYEPILPIQFGAHLVKRRATDKSLENITVQPAAYLATLKKRGLLAWKDDKQYSGFILTKIGRNLINGQETAHKSTNGSVSISEDGLKDKGDLKAALELAEESESKLEDLKEQLATAKINALQIQERQSAEVLEGRRQIELLKSKLTRQQQIIDRYNRIEAIFMEADSYQDKIKSLEGEIKKRDDGIRKTFGTLLPHSLQQRVIEPETECNTNSTEIVVPKTPKPVIAPVIAIEEKKHALSGKMNNPRVGEMMRIEIKKLRDTGYLTVQDVVKLKGVSRTTITTAAHKGDLNVRKVHSHLFGIVNDEKLAKWRTK